MIDNADRIYAFLQLFAVGRRNAMKQQRVAKELEISSRDIQHAMVELAERGKIVCSSCTSPMGIYIPKDLAEITDYLRQLRSRALKTLKHYARIKRFSVAKKNFIEDVFDFDSSKGRV